MPDWNLQGHAAFNFVGTGFKGAVQPLEGHNAIDGGKEKLYNNHN
jgi:hypothetical protein